MPSTLAKTFRRTTGSSVPLPSRVKSAGQSPRTSSSASTAPPMLSVFGKVRASTIQRVLPNSRHTGMRNRF